MSKPRSFSALSRHYLESKDFAIEVRRGTSGYAVMAPHGGRIEPGTEVVADVIAGAEHGYYAFKGIRPGGNSLMHIASNCFDEPRAVALAKSCHTILTVHGCRTNQFMVYVGGGDKSLAARITRALNKIMVSTTGAALPNLEGVHPQNLCNRGKRGKGVQLELSRQFRQWLMGGLRSQSPRCNDRLRLFAGTIRETLAQYFNTIKLESTLNL